MTDEQRLKIVRSRNMGLGPSDASRVAEVSRDHAEKSYAALKGLLDPRGVVILHKRGWTHGHIARWFGVPEVEVATELALLKRLGHLDLVLTLALG